MVVARCAQQVEDARGATILDRPHVLADRLRVEETLLALGEKHEAKYLIALVRSNCCVDDLAVANGVDDSRGEVRAEDRTRSRRAR